MKQTLTPAPAKRSGLLARFFQSKPPAIEEPRKPDEVCGVVFDHGSRRHIAKEGSHQEMLDLFDRWMARSEGTFTFERELALFELYGITDLRERVRDMNLNVCPNFGAGLDIGRYEGKVKGIMSHTVSIHLNRSGLDHFGIPIFDFELLGRIGAKDALHDIRASILSAFERRVGQVTDVKSEFYVFQGLRMLRFLDGNTGPMTDWESLARMFPMVPVPGRLNPEHDFGEIEKLEISAFRMHINKNRD